MEPESRLSRMPSDERAFISLLRQKPEQPVLLLSIKPNYSRLILEGQKKVELRKKMPRRDPKLALLYETAPTMAVTGGFSIDSILSLPKAELNGYAAKAKVGETFLSQYYRGHDTCTVIRVGQPFRFRRHLPLSQLRQRGTLAPTQDFRYIETRQVSRLESLLSR